MASIHDVILGLRPGCTIEMGRKGGGPAKARLVFDYRTKPNRLVIEPGADSFWQLKFLADTFEILYGINQRDSSGRKIPDSRLGEPVYFALLDKAERIAHLKLFEIEVIEAAFSSINDIMLAAKEKLGEHGEGLGCSIKETKTFGGDQMVTITSPRDFVFWKEEWKPRAGEDSIDLRIVPGFHPCMERGGKRTILVNGDNAWTIQGVGLRYVYPPQGSQAAGDVQSMSSWAHMQNPFSARGNEFTVTVDGDTIRTKEGAEALFNLLRGTFEIDGAWVGVSGGFRAPFQSAHNRIASLGIPSPYPRAKPGGILARGSEAHCVWAYYHLLADDRLKDAYIPKWFIDEGWLNIYEGVEVKPGQP
jgi:hypothetical protein